MNGAERRTRRELARRNRILFRRRRLGVLLIGLLLAGAAAAFILGREGDPDESHPDGPAQLPGGGRSVLPERRVVAFYGAPGAPQLGVLGSAGLDVVGKRLQARAEEYRSRGDRPVLPAFELISTLVLTEPGEDGLYRSRQPESEIRRHLEAARRIGALLLLDIQPGRADFPTEVRALEPFLREPDVGIALDPEWRLGPDEIPGEVIGSVEAAEVNAVTDYLSKLVASQDLPDKLLVIHQFTAEMISDKDALVTRPGLDIAPDADGVGTPPLKRAKYRELAPSPDSPFFRGFKLFLEEDTDLMSPEQVLDLKPGPLDFVVYE